MSRNPDLLRAGTPAPGFTLLRTPHESVSLDDLRGHPAVLVFYPGDWESVSREQLVLYQEHREELRRNGATLVAISADSIWSHAAFGHDLNLTFPLLSDAHPKGAASRRYGVYRERDGWSDRAVFVLDAEGIVRWSRVYTHHLNPGVGGTLSALERMCTREVGE